MHTEDSFSCSNRDQLQLPQNQEYERVPEQNPKACSRQCLRISRTITRQQQQRSHDSVFFQLYSHGDKADSGATSTNEPFSVHR